MAIPKVLIASFFLLSLALLLLNDVQASQTNQLQASKGVVTQKIDCGGLCKIRCGKSSRPNLCKRACGTCCYRCQCVPPGTYGNYETCPCYATMTTRGNKRKCP